MLRFTFEGENVAQHAHLGRCLMQSLWNLTEQVYLHRIPDLTVIRPASSASFILVEQFLVLFDGHGKPHQLCLST